MKVVLPKKRSVIKVAGGPLFFLAGPVRGGGDWQRACCEELCKHMSHFYVAIPSRYPETHPLRAFQAEEDGEGFTRQLIWERHYLPIAATNGCVIFWLPCESTTEPHPGPEPYSMDTRGELGEWRGRLMHDSTLRLVIGAEPDFYGLSQIKRNFDLALGQDFPIYSTLAETVAAAVEKAR